MDYPAHPFTVRVTNLAGETEDMDLVDLFRSKCGPVVHAKIVREKSHHPGKHKSKGWGLVQFEDRDSVEKALTLNDLIGIHERLINVDRSHVPAVGLVPPGMHRVKPKGEGKSSKRNQKKREGKLSKDETHEDVTMKDENAKDDESKREVPAKAAATDSASILSFRPRGVARRKPKISLESKKPMDKSNS
jgi:RNA recognition motif-containing protein